MAAGKSTLAKIITGIFTPTTGAVKVDQQTIDSENNTNYRQLFSAIFSDEHLFKQLIGSQDNDPDMSLLTEWLHKLNLQDKVTVTDHRFVYRQAVARTTQTLGHAARCRRTKRLSAAR